MKKSIIISVMLVLFVGVSSVSFASDVSSLIKDLNKKDKAKEASEKLAKIGKPAVPALIKALTGKKKYQKRYAARAIREMGQAGSDAIPALEKLLKDWDTKTREYAVEALGNMVQQADYVIPILKKAQGDDNKEVRKKAKRAIMRIAELVELQEKFSKGEKSYQSPEVLIQDGGIEENIKLGPGCENVKVFDIPLMGSLQEVVDALSKNNIKIEEGYWAKTNKKQFKARCKKLISDAYDFMHCTDSKKQEALAVIDADKIKPFFFDYGTTKYCAEPRSLTYFLDGNIDKYGPHVYPLSYPLFEKFPHIYNSQFIIMCKEFPDYIESQNITDLDILFTNISDKENPLVFVIRLFLTEGQIQNQLNKILTDKYGIPTLCYEHYEPQLSDYYHGYEDNPEIFEILRNFKPSIIRNFKWGHLFRESELDSILYEKVDNLFDVSHRSYPRSKFYKPYSQFYKKGESHGWISNLTYGVGFLLEWDCNDIRVVAIGSLWYGLNEYSNVPSKLRASVLRGVRTKCTFHYVDYMYLPAIHTLDSTYKELSSVSEAALHNLVENGKRGF
ncbi:MAG: HEAT repeat domain-containing protein [Planctomycetota bacterium]